MRIGVNSGSLPKHLHELERENPVEALVTAAVEFVELMERLDFRTSRSRSSRPTCRTRSPPTGCCRERIPYPLHLGITEAGTKWSGSLKSAVGLGTLLADGIGDTIRISLSTFHAEEEVKVAWEILKALKLRERGPVLIACPTCGRLQFDMDTVVADIERRLEAYEDPIEVAVLGCAVNGIGEASHADFGITGAKNEGLIFSRGKPLKKVPQERLVDELFAEIDQYAPDEADRRRRGRAGRRRRVAAADRGGERRRDDAGAAGQARGRAGAGRRRRHRRSRLARRGPAVHAGLMLSRAPNCALTACGSCRSLRPRDPDHAVAGCGEGGVLAAVAFERRARRVVFVAVDLDHEFVRRPERIDLPAGDPRVHAPAAARRAACIAL